jgi:hypothetical protein
LVSMREEERGDRRDAGERLAGFCASGELARREP